ncbi:MAG TPA: type 4a pilus biogenesis protein PilO [Candidatus Baltobacteraceae bacterium]|nr:type 4a pilus biogenesis protein PilO [Candidatus Baltobacteraceae bacterium]
MNFELRMRPGDDVRAAWLLAVLVFCVGLAYVQIHYHGAIQASNMRAEALYAQTVSDSRIIRQASQLRAVANRAQQDLARVSHDSSLPRTTAELLSTLYSSAKTYDARVVAIQPGAASSTANKALDGTLLTIRITGSFRNILEFVEDLSHHSTLISVSDTEMALATGAPGNAAEPRLDATIHAAIYRLHMPGDKGDTGAPAR